MSGNGFSGNKGEWSEPYVVLRLLADGRLAQARDDDEHSPSPDEIARILGVARGDTCAVIAEGGVVNFKFVDADGCRRNYQTSQMQLRDRAHRLFHAICSVTETRGAFELPNAIVSDLRGLGFSRLTNPERNEFRTTKRDLRLRLTSPELGLATLGFSVKSGLGAPPTLLNASEATNILFRVKGLSHETAMAINAIEGQCKIMARCRAIRAAATSIEYERYSSETFHDNLDMVDAALPKMLADLVKTHYFDQILLPRTRKPAGASRAGDGLAAAVALMSREEPYASLKRKDICAIKIRRFLRSCALGLMPSVEWTGIDDASGGYILVQPNGNVVALYVYNTNLFEKYLYESTIFERASTTRHGYLKLLPDGSSGDHLLKLNLQIRFNR